jgi:2-polyprenyl-3-methyl-5-hydroxy-6-metoxy-1,4-benzoquinol methylase
MRGRNRTFLLVPTAGAGEGMGHLARCLRLAKMLDGRVTILTARMSPAARDYLAHEILRLPSRTRPAAIARPGAGAQWDLVFVDARRTSLAEMEALTRHGLVVCLDEGGEARDYAPFLVDAFPRVPGSPPANLSSLGYLGLPARTVKRARIPAQRVLVSFGGEDQAQLSRKLLDALISERLFAPAQLTVVEGPLFSAHEWPLGVTVLKSVSHLSALLSDYDLVFTHFGITAFDALATGVPVILLNPGRYHARLAAAAALPRIGIRVPDMRALRKLLRAPGALQASVEAFNASLPRDRARALARLLESLAARGSSSCPVCSSAGNKVIARFSDRTYRRCRKCGTTYLESFAAEEKAYGKRYFFSDYRAQYGRTYLQDFDSIRAASRPRVRIIRELLGDQSDGVVVDIGCAYGPFLDALKESGVPGYGVDVSGEAVAYVRKKLGIPAVRAAFEAMGRKSLPHRVSAVTLWYVIEHFQQTDLVIRKAASLLPPGGVLAFSTPNGRGISARRQLRVFLQNSPADHFTIFSPQGLERLLAGYGLELRRIRVTGHHPERFPGRLGRMADKSAGAYALVRAASRLLGWGDTFEAYAVKGE